MSTGGKDKADARERRAETRKEAAPAPVPERDLSVGGEPQTLGELLAALERSDNLRSLARECGLTVKELRRRLAVWRREVVTGEAEGVARLAKSAGPASPAAGSPGQTNPGAAARGLADEALSLTPAISLRESPLPADASQILEAWTDGASRGNPGPAAIGIVFRQQGGAALCGHAETIGHSTNNHAEYRAVLRALEFVRDWGVTRLDLYLDSELIARQLTGVYRVKSLELRPLNQQILFLARGLRSFRVRHVPREKNRLADQLGNLALDGKWPRRDGQR